MASTGQLDVFAQFLQDLFNGNTNTCTNITCPTVVSSSSATPSSGTALVITDLRYCPDDLTTLSFKSNGVTYSCAQSSISTCTISYTFPETGTTTYCCSTAGCRVTPTTQPTLATIDNSGTIASFSYCPSDLSSISFSDSTNSINYVCNMGSCTGSKGLSLTSVTGSVTDVTGSYCCFADCPVTKTLASADVSPTISIGLTTAVDLAVNDKVYYCPSDKNSLTIEDTTPTSAVYSCSLVNGATGVTACTASASVGSVSFTTQLVGITGADTYCCSKTT